MNHVTNFELLLQEEQMRLSKEENNNPEWFGDSRPIHEVDPKLMENLQRTADTPPTAQFNNWLCGEGKEDFIWLIRELNTDKPGHIRYALLRAFLAGQQAMEKA